MCHHETTLYKIDEEICNFLPPPTVLKTVLLKGNDTAQSMKKVTHKEPAFATLNVVDDDKREKENFADNQSMRSRDTSNKLEQDAVYFRIIFIVRLTPCHCEEARFKFFMSYSRVRTTMLDRFFTITAI